MKPFLILALISTLVVAACGGGSEQVAGIDGRGAPTPAVSVVAKGSITGFGSVIVNGVTYDTSSATFTVDGNPGDQSDLAVGDVVVVEGTLNNGSNPTASSVTYDDAVEGPISEIDLVAETFTVLGQLVRVDAATSFDDSVDPRALNGLNVGDVIEVSGFFLADGTISATRVELKAAGGELELTGNVSNTGADTFEINGFVIDFSAAMLINFPSGSPEDGQLVEAKGDDLGGLGELIATRVEFKGNDLGDEGDRAEVEGFITSFRSAVSFDVEGVPVETNAQTQYENGTNADLAENRKIEVEGEVNASGVIVASKVEFKPSGDIRIEALVDDVQANQLTVLGIVVQVDESTRFEDDSVADLEIFSLANIVVGDYVEIRGYEAAGGVTATLVERDDFRGEVAIRGFVESTSDPDFVILGVTVSTSAATDFSENDGSSITAGEFFAGADGRLVEANGTLNGALIVADEIEFED